MSEHRTGRPEPGEYADYASADIAAVPGDDAIEAVAHLEEQSRAVFRSLGDAAARGLAYAPGKWTPKEVLGHLIDDERIFACRLLCVARGEGAELPGFDENRYTAHGEFERRTMEALFAEYGVVRAATLALLRGLPPSAWARRGRVNGYTCSVRGLAFHIAGHELHHLRVLRERYLPLVRANPFRIRLARHGDHPAMLDLWERSVRATHGFLTDTDIADLRPHVQQGFSGSAVEWWVVCEEDRVAGFLAYTPGCIEGLFIDPACHRRGLGKLLVSHAQGLAQGPLQLDVNEGNAGALAFYEAQGFVVTGRSPTDSSGRPFPILHMRRLAVTSSRT